MCVYPRGWTYGIISSIKKEPRQNVKGEWGNLGYKARFDPQSMAEELLGGIPIVTVGDPPRYWYLDNKNMVWVPDGKLYLLKTFKDKFPEGTSSNFTETLFEIQALTVLRDKQFQPNPMRLQCKYKEPIDGKYFDSAINLETLNKIYPNPEDYMTKKLDVELDLDSPPPKVFLSALKKTLPDPGQMYLMLQAFASLLLVRTQDIDKIFLLVGSGQNGKSTILHVINKLFEPYVAAVSMHDLINNRFALSQLDDKLANVYADISGLKIRDANVLKLLTSGDLINIDQKYEKMRTTRINLIQFYSANKLPEIEDKTLGIARRMVVIEFNEKIKITDNQIKKKLTSPEELKRTLAMLVRIAKNIKQHGFVGMPSPQEVLDILEEKGNNAVQFLNHSGLVRANSEARSEKDLVYSLYVKYCADRDFIPKTKTAFTQFLNKKGFIEERSGNKRIWAGLEANQPMLKKKSEGQTSLDLSKGKRG